MQKEEIVKEIKDLLKERNALLMAHNYQRDEIQEIADITGDSLALSIEAANTDKDVIVFCGVHFMAESASILSPEKTVILPRMDAGCPMADMITADGLAKKKKELPGVPVITYVNSSADVKAISDICCTSANAVKVTQSLNSKRVYMTPDQNLAQYVAKQMPEKEVLYWEGFCATHHRLQPLDIIKAKEENPDAIFMAHPECTPAVLELADHICSTSGMYEFAKTTDATKIIVGTEKGILYRLKKENPHKDFILPSEVLICPTMKLTTLEDVLDALREMNNVVKVPEETRLAAKKALDRMLAVPRD